jgi:hypothetical protein
MFGEARGDVVCALVSLLVVPLVSQENGLLNFRAIEGKPEGEGTLSGIIDAGGMVRDGDDVLECDASCGVSL